MPTLDLNDALLDPDMLDAFQIKRRFATRLDTGLTAYKTQYLDAVGVVTAGSNDNLNRGAEVQHVEKSLSIVTRFPLQSATKDRAADIVVWHGSDFIVNRIDDYSAYGIGWTQAECSSQQSADPEPAIEEEQ